MPISDALHRAQRSVPVNVIGFANELGVLVHEAWLDHGISGELMRLTDGRYQINVNATDRPTRRRFTIAHELGHYIYHRHLIGEGIDDDRAYRSTYVGRYHNRNIGPAQETEANKFAASLLMPNHLIDQFRDQDIDVRAVANMFEVSEQALSIRLGIPYVG